ncbi:hypothetical protein SCMU_14000 [Sinomonas cyclohexanicum]|uniref:Uncharacterized protein n=1 Tax=Sinomonas cyclohexanicum TaxID=322009 RepID=A0ABN6FFQ7_SINCY|nr:hypothetical protein SCMU_14000 [Corynebacterium cyclohexanicum]
MGGGLVVCRHCPRQWAYGEGLRRAAEWYLYLHVRRAHPEAVVHRDR